MGAGRGMRRDEEVEVESQGGPWVRGLMEVRALSAHGVAPVVPSGRRNGSRRGGSYIRAQPHGSEGVNTVQ